MRATLLMDGITVQHAGELLFDTEATTSQRRACSQTYLRCLEDFAFAVIFGQFSVTGNLPLVGNESPGAELCKAFTEFQAPFEEAKTDPPDALLDAPLGRLVIADWLSALSRVRRSDFRYWVDYIRREADAYLWPADAHARALLTTSCSREQYRFGKQPEYWFDAELEDCIEGQMFEVLVTAAASAHGHVSSDGVREFVRRSLLAHMLIFEWYERRIQGATATEPRVRLPHVTRTTVIQEDTVAYQLWRVQRLMMPHILSSILGASADRNAVRRRIGDLATDSRLQPLRSRLQAALATFDLNELEAIADDIDNTAAGISETRPVDFAIKAGFTGPLPKAEFEARLKQEPTPDRRAIVFALRRSGDIYAEELARATRVFGEL